jgi:hypothetical protein
MNKIYILISVIVLSFSCKQESTVEVEKASQNKKLYFIDHATMDNNEKDFSGIYAKLQVFNLPQNDDLAVSQVSSSGKYTMISGIFASKAGKAYILDDNQELLFSIELDKDEVNFASFGFNQSKNIFYFYLPGSSSMKTVNIEGRELAIENLDYKFIKGYFNNSTNSHEFIIVEKSEDKKLVEAKLFSTDSKLQPISQKKLFNHDKEIPLGNFKWFSDVLYFIDYTGKNISYVQNEKIKLKNLVDFGLDVNEIESFEVTNDLLIFNYKNNFKNYTGVVKRSTDEIISIWNIIPHKINQGEFNFVSIRPHTSKDGEFISYMSRNSLNEILSNDKTKFKASHDLDGQRNVLLLFQYDYKFMMDNSVIIP